MKLFILMLFTIPLFQACAPAKPTQITSNNSIFHANAEEMLNDFIPHLQEEHAVPAVGVGLIENGRIKYIKVFGEHQNGMRAPDDTIFNVASIAKPVVTMAVLKLVQSGEWDLDEPLFHHWTDPDIKDHPYLQLLTSRHVLTHSTGFRNWRRHFENGRLNFDFKPGTGYQYSGEGMEYLRRAIEAKFDIPFNELMTSLVFKPANMNNSTLEWLSPDKLKKFSHWYDGDGNKHQINYETPRANAADDLLTTIEDLSNFSIAVMEQQLVSGNVYRDMMRPQVAVNNRLSRGLGWVVLPNLAEGEIALNHDGGDPGVSTAMTLFPNSKS